MTSDEQICAICEGGGEIEDNTHISPPIDGDWPMIKCHNCNGTGIEPQSDFQPQVPQPDWSQAPEWAQWWAVDADLEAFWYSFKPYPLTNLEDACWQWSDRDEFGQHTSAGEAVLPLGTDWRTTLRKRPDGS